MPKTYKVHKKSKKYCKKSKKHCKKPKKSTKHTRKHRFHGGNYKTDITTQSIHGVPLTKNAMITIPGFGIMTPTAYETYRDNLDRNGSDF